MLIKSVILCWISSPLLEAFLPSPNPPPTSFLCSNNAADTERTTTTSSSTTIDTAETNISRQQRKQELLKLLGGSSSKLSSTNPLYDPVLACPETKEPLQIMTQSPMLEGGSSGIKISLQSLENSYSGRTDTFLNLLQSTNEESSTSSSSSSSLNEKDVFQDAVNALRVFLPPPLRMAGAMAGVDDSYVPMRDLFTSPAVSFAYERGWRQGFASAGFPGADDEFAMVKDFFQPVIVNEANNVVVDMSCATGLFTRRLAKCGAYSRVLGCDYSESMLTEARRRIQQDTEISESPTRLDLIRLDVGNLPFQTESITALHAGAAMHCWPDLDAGLSEIYRSLQPGGRYFASTFLSQYFRTLRATENGDVDVNQQAFQYFESTDQLHQLLRKAGFQEENIQMEVLGAACVIIQCIK